MNKLLFTLIIIIKLIYIECLTLYDECLPVNLLLKLDQSYDCCERVTCEESHVTEM